MDSQLGTVTLKSRTLTFCTRTRNIIFACTKQSPVSDTPGFIFAPAQFCKYKLYYKYYNYRDAKIITGIMIVCRNFFWNDNLD